MSEKSSLPVMKEIDENEVKVFIDKIKQISDYDFSGYSDKSLKRRLQKILFDNELEFKTFCDKIEHNKLFLEKIVKNITVNTTELFRDPYVWISLLYEILPLFLNQSLINIWHAGCSTGQEVYSMLILLNELNLLEKSNLYATDLNSDVLEHARSGIYDYRFNLNYLDNFDKVLRQDRNGQNNNVEYSKYFTIDEKNDRIRMHSFLTEKPVFKKLDLVTSINPFPVKYNLIICRNVIIYFNYELQNKVFKLFNDNLSPGGCLILGVHETMLGPVSLYFEKKFQGYFKK
jgi:chemotaxis protein methyltransferase CheR